MAKGQKKKNRSGCTPPLTLLYLSTLACEAKTTLEQPWKTLSFPPSCYRWVRHCIGRRIRHLVLDHPLVHNSPTYHHRRRHHHHDHTAAVLGQQCWQNGDCSVQDVPRSVWPRMCPPSHVTPVSSSLSPYLMDKTCSRMIRHTRNSAKTI